ncbi:hypothetical protein JNW90_34245 [Micromonospora sp. STR1s_5]|nr:hypothetical protein [Micromonospora sp. STR1s_5]
MNDTIRDELAAREEGRRRAISILKEGFSHGEDRRDWTMIIRGEDDDIVFYGTMEQAAGLWPWQLLN